MRSLIVGILALALPAAAQHDQSKDEKKNPAIGNPEAIAKGSKLYGGSCAGCHGPDGSGGRGPNLVRRAAWHPLTDDDTFDVIRKGVPGADMPPTKLPDDQTWDLVAFVRALTAPAIESRADGDPAAGEQIFWGAKAGCSNCHAIRGKGSRMGPDLHSRQGEPHGARPQ
jgi:mono/diheme cytochrome c family protein